MNIKPTIIVSGDPYGTFYEIFFKVLKKKNFKRPIILIGSKKIILNQIKKFKHSFKIKNIYLNELNINQIKRLNNKNINLIDVNFNEKEKSIKSINLIRSYIENCFKIGMQLISEFKCSGLINGPVNKKRFLNFKKPGVTEYLANKYKIRNFAMLIYNRNLSVCPITTHLPIKDVHKYINKKKIVEKVELIDLFYKKKLKKKPKIAITGFNPHCESSHKINEEDKHIKPAIKYLKQKKIFAYGPFSADTIFMKNQIEKFDVVVGMYHDQVLTPIKALYNFDAINITLGLPFIRISPDHGPNEIMYGKNMSNPNSLYQAIKFLDN
jgi:4-hydroxythreonine-4-phosphate dehydrogenase